VQSLKSEMGQKAADRIDETRGAAAGGLDSAAATLHEKANTLPGGDRVTSAAHTAADAVENAAEYVRENDAQSMLADVKRLLRNHPGPALLVATTLALLIARTFLRR
jgi:hypothetical protein